MCARAVAAAGAVLLCSCASALVERGAPASALAAQATAFELTGRLSARRGNDALSANFRWTHEAQRDELDLSSPLGQTIARLSSDASGVRLQTPDGRVETAGDWAALTTHALGWPLPVEGLAFWIQGVPRDGCRRPSSGQPTVCRLRCARMAGASSIRPSSGAATACRAPNA
jgi:outer membrane lipoprotein LolB